MNSAKPRIEILESRVAPATFTVTTLADSGTGSLRDALAKADASPGPDTIKFKLPTPPAHGENVILLTTGELKSKGNVTITGPGSGKLIIDANNASRVFDFNDGSATTDSPTTISGLSIIRGKTSGFGGGVYSAESLTLNDVVVSQCSALNGGGVVVRGSALASQKVQISNSIVTGNSTTGTVGGLGISGVEEIMVERTIVSGNTAGLGVGGAYLGVVAAGTGIAVSGCQVNGNSASYGGGIDISNRSTLATAKTTVSDTTIAGNVSTGKGAVGGGGLLIEHGQTVISGSTIENNSAVYFGGGIDVFNTFQSLTIKQSTISGNQTTSTNATNQGGGGIFIAGSGNATPQPVDISSSSISDNRSAYFGGGLAATGGIALTISGTTFADNHAVNGGGGVLTTGTGTNKVDITVIGSKFANNVAIQSGGGLNASGDGRVSISSSKVIGNVVSFGGGGILATSTAVNNGVILKNLTVGGNSCGSAFVGGGVAILNTPDFHVTGGSFSDNNGGAGGGIAVSASGGSIRGASVTRNVAQFGGGVYQAGAGTVILQVAKVHNNTAPTSNGPDVSGAFTFV
jgi:hypothetical protein